MFALEPTPMRYNDIDSMKTTAQRVALWICRRIAAFGSLILSLYGCYCWLASGLQQDWYVVTLYCVLPMLSFPVFLLSKWQPRLSIALHWVLAFGYLAVFSALDWRTCSELEHCSGVAATALAALTTLPVEITFAVAIANLAVSAITRRAAKDAASSVASSN